MILALLKQFGGYVALGLLVVFLWMRLDAVGAERDLAEAQVSTLSAQIKEQNKAVLALKEAATRNREVYLAGLDAANRRAIRLEIKAEDYLNTPIPSDPAEACEVADQILTEVTR